VLFIKKSDYDCVLLSPSNIIMMRKNAPKLPDVAVVGSRKDEARPRKRRTFSGVILPVSVLILVLVCCCCFRAPSTTTSQPPAASFGSGSDHIAASSTSTTDTTTSKLATINQQQENAGSPNTPLDFTSTFSNVLDTSTTPKMELPKESLSSIAPPVPCSEEEVKLLRGNQYLQQPELLSIESRCPSSKWLERMLDIDSKHHRIGVNVGCNKAVDAIGMARQMSRNPLFHKRPWVKTMQNITHVKVKMMCAVWGGQSKKRKRIQKLVDYSQVDLTGDQNNTQSMEYHCIEPMPSTHQVLQQSAKLLGLSDCGFHIHPYVISNTSGTALFPNSDAGTENMSAGSCSSNQTDDLLNCQKVPMLTLDDFAAKHLDQNDDDAKRKIDVLSIDTEGFDLPVLRGARQVLKRTRYLEFEYHGVWAKEHLLKDAVDLLDELQFVCYFAGQGRLFKVTGATCWIEDLYEIRMWSNIACVHRSEHAWLDIMEQTFLDTLVPSATANTSDSS
jgi:FkbM family methyltransferase